MNLSLAFVFWLVMAAIAVANGFVGETVVARLYGGYASHIYKTAVIIAVIFLFSRVYLRWAVRAGDPYIHALSAGILWLVSSIIFEFIFGHYVFGFSWERLFADYRIWEGRLWALVLLSEVAAPLINAYLLNTKRVGAGESSDY
jgi:hypothetical protein